jgi:molecular chaperone DnaK (HSP70)
MLINNGTAVAVNYAMTTITINGAGYNCLAGGTELDCHLYKILVAKFEHRHGMHIQDDSKAMVKLLTEHLKSILSANTKESSQEESVYNDIDFSMKVMCQVFENIYSNMNA